MGQPVRVQVPPSASSEASRISGRPFGFLGGHSWILKAALDPADIRIVETHGSCNGPGNGIHVLIVDDHPEVLEILSELLEESGYRVTCCSGGLSALLTMGRVRPDLMLLDLKLDDISGFDVYRAVRADAEFVDLPVIFVSGVFLEEEIIRARSGDASARLLLKPIPGEVLVAEIEQAVGGRRRAA